jgi:hypothetical protein
MEIIVILGILLVVAIAVVFAIRGGGILSSPVPEGIYSQQREVAASVKNVIRDATDETLKVMMMHGGYLDRRVPGVTVTSSDVPHVDFLLSGVPYWQRCEETMYPDITEVKGWMEKSIEDIIRNGMDDIEGQYGNRTVFDKSKIDVVVDIKGMEPFEPDTIGVTVTMPTTVRGYPLPEGDLHPYKIGFDTKFGRAYSFGKDFAEASADNRYFDVFSIAAIYLSQELENTHTRLPTAGVMTQCGEVVYRSPQQINSYLLEILEYVMSTTQWWQGMENLCPGGTCLSQTKSFAIEDLEGAEYPELDVRTVLADDWVFKLVDYVFATNFEMPKHGGFVVPVCTQTYNHAYDFSYPFIIRVKDPYTGYSFSFASEVSVKEGSDRTMEPGDCSPPGGALTGCENLPCHGRVGVVDNEGRPLEGAFVVFGGCPVGETGADGYAEGPIKCGNQELFVYRTSDYEFLKRTVSWEALNRTHTVTLNPVREIRVHFWEVEITTNGYYESDEERIFTECDACPRSCDITDVTSQQCSIGLVSREQMLVEFDNGYMKLPVTNIDSSGAAAGCSDTADCQTCSEHASEMEEGDADDSVFEACKRCAQGCYSPPLHNTQVNYLPSGYDYAVNGIMFDPLDDYRINGAFLYNSLSISEDDTELNVYMPNRSEDRSGYLDQDVTDKEKRCLAQALMECGIMPVSTEKYVSSTVVLPPSDYDCVYMKGLIVGCGGSPDPGTFRDCVGEDDEPLVCCDKADALEQLRELEESCGVRVIMPGVG